MEKSFLKSLGKDTLLYIPSKIIPALLGIVSISLFTRMLSPEEFGRYTLVNTVIAFTGTLCFSWLEQALLRYYKAFEEERDEVLSTVFFTTLVLLVIVSLLFLLFVNVLADIFAIQFSIQVVFLLNLSVIFLFVRTLYRIVLQYLRASREINIYSISSCTLKIIYVFSTFIILYFLGWREESLIIGMIISHALIFIILYKWKIKKEINLRLFFFDKKKFLLFLKYGAPWLGITVGLYLLSKFDRYVIELYLSTEQVGIYSATYDIAEKGIAQFASILSISSLPILINNFEKRKKDDTSAMLKEILRIYVIVFIPAVVGLSFLSEEILNLLLGAEFRGADLVFILIAVGAFFEAFRNVVDRPYQLMEKTYFFPLLLIISGILNLALNFILVPTLGIEGAAVATIVGYAFYFFLAVFISRRFFKWVFPFETICKSLIGSIIMFIALFFNPIVFKQSILNLGWNIFLGVVTYVVIMIVLKEELTVMVFDYLKKRVSHEE